MDKFAFKGNAEIRHLNIRKEGPEDDKVLAIDIKFECVVNADMFDFFHDGLRFALYTDVGARKNLMLKPIGFDNTIMNCELTILDRTYHGVDVSKITLEPKDVNLATLVFAVSVKPTGDEVARFSEFVMDEVPIEIRPEPELDFEAPKPKKRLKAVLEVA